MTVRRLLTEASSLELTQWQAFLVADAQVQQERAESARLEREFAD